MLDHEIMFKKQVQELHGMYGVQKMLVKEDSMYQRCEVFPMKRTFSEFQTVGPSRFTFDQDFGSRFQQRPLDLRLSIGNSCTDEDVLDSEELNLSLSIGMTSNKRIKSSRKPQKDTVVIIDLEDSNETASNESPKANLNQGSNGLRDVKPAVLLDLDLNKDQPDEYPPCDGSYGNQTATSLTSKSQPKTRPIDLESLPEPSSDLTEEKESSISESSKQNKKTEPDNAVDNAARALLCISTQQPSTPNQDSATKSKENKKKTTRRSSSIDSYESLVLKLEESSTEEDSATSKTYVMHEFDQKESRIKLKRGRRLKNFQKDILPTLSSLSKQEIWEDIKLLEGVIRSREYKRLNKAKTGKGENQLTPTKTKRVEVNSTGKGESQLTPAKSKRAEVNSTGQRSSLRQRKS